MQRGQELIWVRKDTPSDRRFQVTNISEEPKLNVIVRTKGGASLHSWNLGFSVKCGDNNQPLTPVTHEVPRDLAANLFTNVGAVEIAEFNEPNSSGVKVQPCS